METLIKANSLTLPELTERIQSLDTTISRSKVQQALYLSQADHGFGRSGVAHICDTMNWLITDAYRRIEVIRPCVNVGLSDEEMEKLGWKKLVVVAPFLATRAVEPLLAYARTHKLTELRAYVNAPKTPANSIKIKGYFRAENIPALIKVLGPFGLKHAGKSGYEGFEDALKAYIIAKGDWPKSTQPD